MTGQRVGAEGRFVTPPPGFPNPSGDGDRPIAVPSYLVPLIEDIRAHGGQVTEGPMAGEPMLILTSLGARSGEPRIAVLNYHRDGERLVVAATKGGAPTHPAWYHNLVAHPEVTIEVDGQVHRARATAIVDGPERDRLWAGHVRALPKFAEYILRTSRVIPMVVLDLLS